MSRELLLLRHAKSDWSVDVVDFERPLKKRGKKAARKVGEWLQKQNLNPDWVISSPAVRALKTTEKVCKVINFKMSRVNIDRRIYESDVVTLIKVLADCPEHARRVLLVGHNPGLEMLLNYLTDNVIMPEDDKLMATATLARLRVPENWAALNLHCAELLSLSRVKSMVS